MEFHNDQLKKALVTLVIENVLLDMGKPVYEKVVKQLSKDYKCYLPDCYEYPNHLNIVLKKIFGNSYIAIIDSIKKELDEYKLDKPIENFLICLSE